MAIFSGLQLFLYQSKEIKLDFFLICHISYLRKLDPHPPNCSSQKSRNHSEFFLFRYPLNLIPFPTKTSAPSLPPLRIWQNQFLPAAQTIESSLIPFLVSQLTCNYSVNSINFTFKMNTESNYFTIPSLLPPKSKPPSSLA